MELGASPANSSAPLRALRKSMSSEESGTRSATRTTAHGFPAELLHDLERRLPLPIGAVFPHPKDLQEGIDLLGGSPRLLRPLRAALRRPHRVDLHARPLPEVHIPLENHHAVAVHAFVGHASTIRWHQKEK